MEESARPRASRRPETSSRWRNHPAGSPSGVRKPPMGGGNTRVREQKGGSRSVTLDGNPDVECGGVLLSHTLSSAVPSPRPGLSFRVRKGTGRLTWAMTTAKPIQRSDGNHRTGGTETSHTTDSGRGGPGTGQRTQANQTPYQYRHRDHKKQRSLPSNEKTTTGRDPTPKGDRKECAAFAR